MAMRSAVLLLAVVALVGACASEPASVVTSGTSPSTSPAVSSAPVSFPPETLLSGAMDGAAEPISGTIRILCRDLFGEQGRFCTERMMLDVTGDLRVILASEATRQQFHDQGLDGDYAVDGLNGPRLTIVSRHRDRAVAVDTVQEALSFVEDLVAQGLGPRPDNLTTVLIDAP